MLTDLMADRITRHKRLKVIPRGIAESGQAFRNVAGLPPLHSVAKFALGFDHRRKSHAPPLVLFGLLLPYSAVNSC